ncbi:metallophosphoesterase [Millisia brevis]|uniref:metallophosphoesterase n=1 Tax=Millisia brevis TaxID=264148 RepID=UPI000A02A809|nr:metallophosphoesterase [Millisia brevis]
MSRTALPVRSTSGSSSTLGNVATAALTGAALTAAGIGYATLIERNAFTLRTLTLTMLPPGTTPLRILHISDLHMTPSQRLKQHFLRSLDSLEPDLVINTGDNLSHPKAVPSVVQSLGPLLNRPGAFVFGSNDYFAPVPKNPLTYLTRTVPKKPRGEALPWQDLRAAFTEQGWLDATHSHRTFTIGDHHIAIAGVDDPHIGRDRYPTIAGPADPEALTIGLTHSPEPRILDQFARDGYELVLAGHTHGGQLCVPFYGPVITNCELDRSRAKGLSQWGEHTLLHVSAGLGTSPWAPARFCCRPEASLITLEPIAPGNARASQLIRVPRTTATV